MLTIIKIRDINNNIYNALEFALINFYFLIINNYIAYFQREIYIINNLDINALININILYLKEQILNLLNKIIKLTYNLDLKIKLEIIIKSEKIKRYVIIKAKITISLRLYNLILFIKLKDNILDLLNRDILFKLFNKALIIFIYLISVNISIIIIENNIDNFVILLEYTYLDFI